MRPGAIIDRALEPAWLDLALSLVSERPDEKGGRRQLELVLRDRIPAREGRVKTVKVLIRVWSKPAEDARGMVHWATERARQVGDSKVLHIGAIMASYPFFGRACAIIGRELSLHGEILTPQIRRRLRAEWADREIVDVSTRAVIRTLRAFGVLEGKVRTPLSVLGKQILVPPLIAPWLIHSLLLTRRVDAIDSRQVDGAPEFFMFKLPTNGWPTYPFLERFSEGGGRVVFQRLVSPPAAGAETPQLVLFKA